LIVYSRHYEVDLGGHVWPIAKYRLIAARLVEQGHVPRVGFVEPEPCSWDDLALVHTPDYLDKVRNGRLSEQEIRMLELPWIPEVADGFRLMSGGTCRAAELALGAGVAVHLGGGLHHAFPDHGEGFCLFNDVAVAIRKLQGAGLIRRAAVVDCDVHHGNGTAFIFAIDPSVFTFSIHQQLNYPAWKPASDLDIGLPDGTGDDEYLARLAEALPKVIGSRPDLIVYLAGSDPFREDQLGGLSLTLDGLRRRDRLVLDAAAGAGAPVAIVLAGGYAARVEDTVTAHVNTVVEALKSKRPAVSA
jgi:acetoin utilization deacetylase AcuC-like enzyme